MRPQLRALASLQGGLVTRAQAVTAGYTERELRSHTAVHGPWAVVRRGVYAERDLWDSLTGYDEKARLRDLAVHLSMRTKHLMSHDSAARLLGLPMLRPRHELSHVTREGVVGTRTERGVKHHLTRLGLLNTEIVDGVRVTGLARTAVDLAREHGLDTGVVACDRFLSLGHSREQLESELLLMWCWPEVTRAKAAVHLADGGAESPGESLTRLLVVELGLGEVETQFSVRIDDQVVRTDLRVGCHVIEFDGRVKFRDVTNGGVATREIEEILWDERTRQQRICAEGLGMSRVTWDELFGAQRARTKQRLRAEYDVTARRFGEVLPPHLEAFAARMRRRRGQL